MQSLQIVKIFWIIVGVRLCVLLEEDILGFDNSLDLVQSSKLIRYLLVLLGLRLRMTLVGICKLPIEKIVQLRLTFVYLKPVFVCKNYDTKWIFLVALSKKLFANAHSNRVFIIILHILCKFVICFNFLKVLFCFIIIVFGANQL